MAANNESSHNNILVSEQDDASFFEGIDNLFSGVNETTDASSLADQIYKLGYQKQSETQMGTILYRLWWALFDFIQNLDPSAQEHAIVAQALDNLRKRDSKKIPFRSTSEYELLWEDLPDLGMYMRDFWSGPTHGLSGDPKVDKEWLPSKGLSWRSMNTFAARLMGYGDLAVDIYFPIWELRDALEKPAIEGPAMECRILASTVWLIHAGGELHKWLATCGEFIVDKEHKDNWGRVLKVGPQCKALDPLSLDRWFFWKFRLTELAKGPYDASVKEQIAQALKTMDALTSQSIPTGEPEQP